MQDDHNTSFRPPTPNSPLTSSLHHATSTIDELTLALANFSRVPSPEPPALSSCCCGNDDCENLKAWQAHKAQLENRLILSAEVGQALLQRHEAYVRQRESHTPRASSQDDVDYRVEELLKEKAALEKSLTRALVNNEVSEVSNNTVLHELQEARATITRLTAHHARSVGLETRLNTVTRERDDLQQERDSEAQRAKVAESRILALQERTSKLQAEIRRLQDDLEQRRLHRLESSDSILQDARARLEILQHSKSEHNAIADQDEVTKVLESLVADNEVLKRDNTELRRLLADSREDLYLLQEEVEEHRAHPPSHVDALTPRSRQSFHIGSVPSSARRDHMGQNSRRPASSEPRSRRPLEPLTPETNRRPLSPTESETKWSSFSQPQPRYAASNIIVDVDDESLDMDDHTSPEQTKAYKTLFLLTRSRGVQTDAWHPSLAPSPLPSHMSSPSPQDPRSESSSFSDTHPSQMGVLVERVNALLNRMTQADALTLTNRLKRQHLRGADVSHLSRSTVGNIVGEVAGLRTQFRAFLEDDRVTTICTRKDLRGLLKLFREVFTELGQIRVTLNDVILDPLIAVKVREQALDPTKADADKEKQRVASGSPAGGWMAPISKLFGTPTGQGENNLANRGLSRANSGRSTPPPTRVIPKLGPALAASTTTVNVEFSGNGVGRSVTSTFAGPSLVQDPQAVTSSHDTSTRVMGIFAGAPRAPLPDAWVVIPKAPQRMQSTLLRPGPDGSSSTLRRSPLGGPAHRPSLSRNVDAVIDVDAPRPNGAAAGEEPDALAPLLQRTLRRRGLSDSSIHSTFTSHADDTPASVPTHDAAPDSAPLLGRGVLQALGRRVQGFRLPSATSPEPDAAASTPAPARHAFGDAFGDVGTVRAPAAHSFAALIPHLTAWGSAGGLEQEPFYVGSAREESLLHRARRDGAS